MNEYFYHEVPKEYEGYIYVCKRCRIFLSLESFGSVGASPKFTVFSAL